MPNTSVNISLSDEELKYLVNGTSIKKKTVWALVTTEVNKAFEGLDDVPEDLELAYPQICRKNFKVTFPPMTWRKLVRLSGQLNLSPTQFVHRLIISQHFAGMVKEAMSNVKPAKKVPEPLAAPAQAAASDRAQVRRLAK